MSTHNGGPPSRRALETLSSDASYSTEAVDLLLKAATELQASDLHLQPTAEGLDVRWRIDGVLNPVVVLPGGRPRRSSPGSRCWPSCSRTGPTFRRKAGSGGVAGRGRDAAVDVSRRFTARRRSSGSSPARVATSGSAISGFPRRSRSTLRRLLGATSGA